MEGPINEIEQQKESLVPDEIPTSNTIFELEFHPQQDYIAYGMITGEIEL